MFGFGPVPGANMLLDPVGANVPAAPFLAPSTAGRVDHLLTAAQMTAGPSDAVMMSVLDDDAFDAFDGLPPGMVLDGAAGVGMPQLSSLPAPNSRNAILGVGDRLLRAVGGAENLLGGPLPAGLGLTSSATAGSTLTEFTKKKHWPATVVGELRDLLYILNSDGRITHVSASVVSLTGYTVEELVGRFLKDFLHQDDIGVFVAELNESIASGNPLRMFYRLKKRDGTYAVFESVGHAHIAAAKFAPNPENQSPFCQAVFLMSRPYPTKNARLLDSFLEHKVENERLKRRIAELRREEADDADEAQRSWQQSQEGLSDITPSEDAVPTGPAGQAITYHGADGSMPPPERPPALNSALTRENLEGMAGSRPDSIKDKMARYEGSAHTDTIEMLTGLRYTEGERSRGISTGNRSPRLIKGDAGIAIPLDRDLRQGDKKKKPRIAEEYVCTDCGRCSSTRPAVFASDQDQEPWNRRNGVRGPAGRRLFATPAASDGPRRKRRRTRGPPASLAWVRTRSHVRRLA